MKWLKAQLKSMPLPGEIPPMSKYRYKGIEQIDKMMSDEIAQQEKQQHNPQYFGAGTRGIAWLNPNEPDVIRKYTTDHKEYLSALQLKENPIPCTVTVFDAKPLTNGIWVIELDRAHQLPIHHKMLIEQVIRNYGNMEVILRNSSPIDLVTALGFKHNQENVDIVNKYQQLLLCLEHYDYSNIDIIPDNIGYNEDQEMVILDVGSIYKPSYNKF